MGEIEHRTEELNPEDEVVVYCHVGQRSAAVAEYLAQLGFKNAKNLLGGLDYGAQSVDPAMRSPSPRRMPGTTLAATNKAAALISSRTKNVIWTSARLDCQRFSRSELARAPGAAGDGSTGHQGTS